MDLSPILLFENDCAANLDIANSSEKQSHIILMELIGSFLSLTYITLSYPQQFFISWFLGFFLSSSIFMQPIPLSLQSGVGICRSSCRARSFRWSLFPAAAPKRQIPKPGFASPVRFARVHYYRGWRIVNEMMICRLIED